MRANADVIWVFVESKFCFALFDASRECAVFATALRIMMRAIADVVWARARSVRWSQCFLLSRWCNPNAVHVDPRLHCSDIATSRGLGGQQMAKKRKAKKAKKARKKK